MNPDRKYFNLLKKDLVRTLKNSFPEINEDIESWKGHEIALFQEELIKKVNSRVSEKWFYTHIKGNKEEVPRIDMLNLLSRYVGYQNWTEYKSKNRLGKVTRKPGKLKRWPLILLILLIPTAFLIYKQTGKKKKYNFCFKDAYSGQAARTEALDVFILSNRESPIRVSTDQNCCFSFETERRALRFVARSSYYHMDTIRRIHNGKKAEVILLQPNDFGIAWDLIRTSETGKWKERKELLISMFSEDARIIEVNENSLVGIEMYNREEFIDKISLPVSSIQNMQIIDVEYENDLVKVLRYKKIRS